MIWIGFYRPLRAQIFPADLLASSTRVRGFKMHTKCSMKCFNHVYKVSIFYPIIMGSIP
ncbi:hypothetical protein HanHA300_Chr02g0043501 [Helianthus annuus]|nr:hypothetical protein HanHA300_Chr02g0043501 [Helianthus annuus]KAJ0617899.1 hypothetical protein HanHA89_Chr02g0046951 [Helianthus annuus]